MTFVPNKPDSGPSPFVDASVIQTNFAQWGSIFDNNHIGMNLLNQGDHSSVIFENQANDPGVTNDYVSLYNKNASATTGGSQPQLFFQIPEFLPTKYDKNDKPNVGMQLTYNQVNTTGPSQYQSFLPGGYLLYFGSTTNIAIPITLSPIPSSIVIAIATATSLVTGNPATVSTTVNSPSQFTINSNATNPYEFRWFVIARV